MFKIWLRTAVVILVLLLGGIWYLERSSAAETAQGSDFAQIVTMQQGTLSSTISVVGELSAPENEELLFDRLDETTTLLTLDVAAGNVVEAGDVLATIDPAPFQKALEAAEIDLAEAEATLADLQAPPTTLERSQASLAVSQAGLAISQAEEDLADLLELDLSDLQESVVDAQSQLEEAQFDLADLQVEQADDESIYTLLEDESELAADYSRLSQENYSDAYYEDRLRLAYNAMMDVQDERVTAQLEQEIALLNAQISVRQAERNLTNAQSELAEGQVGVDALELAQVRQAIAQAEMDLAEAREDEASLDDGPDAVDLATARTALVNAQQAVTDVQADLDATTLVAPFAGTVLQTDAAEGNSISASSVILTLANLNSLEVVASVDETTIRDIEVGQSAEISFDAYPGQTFSGQVTEVPLQGELSGDVMVYEVTLSLDGAEDLGLRVGMTANVDVQSGGAEEALLVPSMAIQSTGNGSQVLIASADSNTDPVAVAVETGISNGVYTEILSGLALGDQVVVELTAADSSSTGFGGGPNNNSGLLSGLSIRTR